MSLRHHKGYWTVFVRDQPVMSYVNFESAWAAMWEICKS